MLHWNVLSLQWSLCSFGQLSDFSKPVGHCILSYETTCKFRTLASFQRFAKPEITSPDLGLASFFAVRPSINSNLPESAECDKTFPACLET